MARDPSPASRQKARERTDSKWATIPPPKGRRGPSRHRQEAATDSATVDLIDWLSENPSAIDLIQELGDLLTCTVIGELDKRFGGNKPRESRRRLTDHFWCDLLVTLAEGIEKFAEALDQVPEYVADAIIKSRRTDHRSSLVGGLVTLAVRTAWEPIKGIIYTSGVEELQRTCRILAVLICPAPENHTAVQDGALLPLAKEGMLEISKERLAQVFPEDWVQRLRDDLDGA
ncbi:hypothetical protein OG589_35365 [Sphaerisporangium sp. NBC_01403]|uniref:hypothetical protein n=1 Tax=Sphaerisporangium sp. NBC_01403 TaxID=2903599 RepID=UPI00324F30EF